MLWDNLTGAEAEFTRNALAVLNGEPWAKPLIRTIDDAGGICHANSPLLFEARIAYALHRRGVKADYEYPTGVGNSCVDFRVGNWLIEIVKIGESEAAKAATHRHGRYVSRVLQTPSSRATAAEAKQSPEGELLLVEQKIAEKVMKAGKPAKFPIPTAGALQMIIVDMRAFLNGGDTDDYGQIAYGRAGVDDSKHVHTWLNPVTQKAEPVKGLFQPENPLRGAGLLQKRVHFLGFVVEKSYTEGEIPRVMCPIANPHLLGDKQAAATAWNTNPLSSGWSSSPLHTNAPGLFT